MVRLGVRGTKRGLDFLTGKIHRAEKVIKTKMTSFDLYFRMEKPRFSNSHWFKSYGHFFGRDIFLSLFWRLASLYHAPGWRHKFSHWKGHIPSFQKHINTWGSPIQEPYQKKSRLNFFVFHKNTYRDDGLSYQRKVSSLHISIPSFKKAFKNTNKEIKKMKKFNFGKEVMEKKNQKYRCVTRLLFRNVSSLPGLRHCCHFVSIKVDKWKEQIPSLRFLLQNCFQCGKRYCCRRKKRNQTRNVRTLFQTAIHLVWIGLMES